MAYRRKTTYFSISKIVLTTEGFWPNKAFRYMDPTIKYNGMTCIVSPYLVIIAATNIALKGSRNLRSQFNQNQFQDKPIPFTDSSHSFGNW